jgi:transcriptional regulator with XRE-family HTH domain
MEPPYKPTNIRAWRQERGLTMIELAEKAGMHQGHLSKLERGLMPYTQQSLERLAEALRLTPGALIDTPPPKK